MGAMSSSIVFYGIVLISANILALGVLPRTAGFTAALPTAICIAAFVITSWALSRLVYSGMRLTILVPLAAAVIPLATIFVAMLFYGEPASARKVGLLVVACGLIGLAARG